MNSTAFPFPEWAYPHAFSILFVEEAIDAVAHPLLERRLEWFEDATSMSLQADLRRGLARLDPVGPIDTQELVISNRSELALTPRYISADERRREIFAVEHD